jgi:aldehyde dehydrogenase (NAD+)
MDTHALIAEQRRYFTTGKTRDVEFRIQQLKQLKKALQSSEQMLVQAVQRDFGRSEFDTFTLELMWLHRDIDEAVRRVKKWARREPVRTNWFNQWGRSYIIPEPLGVCVVIGAWNYPYRLSLAPVVGALAAGNTVILKPSELASHACQCLQDVIRAHFEPGYFVVVQGGADAAEALLEQRVDKVFFTGSTRVGKLVYQAAAKHLTPVSLELGGKSPALVARGCDVELAAKRIVWAKFVNAGQTCIAPDYVLVDTQIEERFCRAVKAEITRADYALHNRNYVRIINDAHMQRLSKLIDHAKLYVGGHVDFAERFIQPTVLRGVGLDDPVMAEEIFGPILPVVTVESMQQAIAIVNQGEKPLACYVFCDSVDVREQVLTQVSFGGGCVNDAALQISNPYLPFGGVAHSGIGKYHGEAGFSAFSHYKGILERGTLDNGLRYSPHSEAKLSWIRRLAKWALN